MIKLKSLLTQGAYQYPSIKQGSNNLMTSFASGLAIQADNSDTFDTTRAGNILIITFIWQNDTMKKLIDQNKDELVKLYKKHFDDIYDRPVWSSTNSPNRKTLFSSGTLGGMAWLFPHFQQFADDVSKLMYKELYK